MSGIRNKDIYMYYLPCNYNSTKSIYTIILSFIYRYIRYILMTCSYKHVLFLPLYIYMNGTFLLIGDCEPVIKVFQRGCSLLISLSPLYQEEME